MPRLVLYVATTALALAGSIALHPLLWPDTADVQAQVSSQFEAALHRARQALDEGETDERPCVLLSFSNSRYTGGAMMMAPHADATDGELDMIRIGGMGRLSFVKSFPSIFAGAHVEHPKVEETRAKTVDLDLTEPVDVMVDGEVLELALKRLEVVPGALEVVA